MIADGPVFVVVVCPMGVGGGGGGVCRPGGVRLAPRAVGNIRVIRIRWVGISGIGRIRCRSVVLMRDLATEIVELAHGFAVTGVHPRGDVSR